jgi:hypothetical protein
MTPAKLLIAMVLAHLSSCAGTVCELFSAEMFAPTSVRITSDVITVGPLVGDGLVVASNSTRGPNAINITYLGQDGLEREATIPPLQDIDTTWSVFRRETGWWFSRWGSDAEGRAVFFVVDGAVRRRAVEPEHFPLEWLPLRGEEPRGLLLSVAKEQPALRFDEVTPDGVEHVAVFPWWQAFADHKILLASRWTAESLGEGRFAVIAVDGPEGALALTLRVIDNGTATEHVLPCVAKFDHPIASAHGPGDTIAIVGRSAKGEILAMVVDVGNPVAARCRVISDAEEVATRPLYLYGTPAVIWSGDRFIAAWVRNDGTVRACELGELRVQPIVVNLGDDANGEDPLRQMLHPEGDIVAFTWRDRSGNAVVRRMPTQLAGYALARDLRDLICRLTRELRP